MLPNRLDMFRLPHSKLTLSHPPWKVSRFQYKQLCSVIYLFINITVLQRIKDIFILKAIKSLSKHLKNNVIVYCGCCLLWKLFVTEGSCFWRDFQTYTCLHLCVVPRIYQSQCSQFNVYFTSFCLQFPFAMFDMIMLIVQGSPLRWCNIISCDSHVILWGIFRF